MRRLTRRIVADGEVMSISTVARRCGSNWHLVMALVRCWSDQVAEQRRSLVRRAAFGTPC